VFFVLFLFQLDTVIFSFLTFTILRKILNVKKENISVSSWKRNKMNL